MNRLCFGWGVLLNQIIQLLRLNLMTVVSFFSSSFHIIVGIECINIDLKCVACLYVFLLLYFILFCPQDIPLLTYIVMYYRLYNLFFI